MRFIQLTVWRVEAQRWLPQSQPLVKASLAVSQDGERAKREPAACRQGQAKWVGWPRFVTAQSPKSWLITEGPAAPLLKAAPRITSQYPHQGLPHRELSLHRVNLEGPHSKYSKAKVTTSPSFLVTSQIGSTDSYMTPADHSAEQKHTSARTA